MAKDGRLYARLDIGFDEHDKIYPLSDAAFRALIEVTLYARRQMTDGFLGERMAVKRWGADVIDELCTNDPVRPSLVRVEGGWQIHDFAEHQTTNADIEAKREAGRAGGLAKAANRVTAGVAPASEVLEQKASTTLAKTETETETKTKRDSAAKRGSRVSKDFTITNEMREWAKKDVPLVNVDVKLPEWIDYWTSIPGAKGVKLDWESTWRNGMRKQQEWAQKDNPQVQAPRRVVSGRVK